MRGITIAILLSFIGIASALAADANVFFPSNELGAGQALRYGMTSSEAKRIFPGLNPISDVFQGSEPKDDPEFATIGTDMATASGCRLSFTLRFFKDRLDQVGVTTSDGSACHQKIERALTARFHDADVPLGCPNIIHREWKDDASAVIYDYNCASSNNDINIQYSEANDLSGRIADEKRFAACQIVKFDIASPQETDGASDPVPAPGLPDLDCGGLYPPVSVRLQEQGAPNLSVRVAADGSVTEATLAQSSGKPRLDDAALRLVKTTLKFTPAMKNGQPVEAVRQMTVTYKLLHLIHGQCACAVPFNPSPPPIVPPAIAIVPAKDGGKLQVTSPDFEANNGAVAKGVTINGAQKSPTLKWTAGPAETRSYLLIAEVPRRGAVPLVGWIVYDIPASVHGVPQGTPNDLRLVHPQGAMTTIVRTVPGYQNLGGRAHFEIFALDTKLTFDPKVKRADLIEAMTGHVLASGEIVSR